MLVYAPIPPINYIEKVTERTKSIFMLAQLWSIEEYRNAITNSNLKLIVLDNGAYEGELVSDKRLIEVIGQVSELHPKAKIYAIIPDEMQNPEMTLKRTESFLQFMESNGIKLPKNVSLLGVIQVDPNVNEKTAIIQTLDFSGKLIDLTHGYGVHLGGFAIPVWFYRKWGYRDVFGLTLRLVYNDHMYIHALGLDDFNELRYIQYGFDSFDTSMPFTLAYYGLPIKEVPLLDKSTKQQLGIDRVPLKHPVLENSLYMKNLEEILKLCK